MLDGPKRNNDEHNDDDFAKKKNCKKPILILMGDGCIDRQNCYIWVIENHTLPDKSLCPTLQLTVYCGLYFFENENGVAITCC